MRPDLKKHLIVGAALGASVSAAVSYVSGPVVGVCSGYAVAWAIGWGKETLWDRAAGQGTYNPEDANYTGVGGLLGALPASLTYLL